MENIFIEVGNDVWINVNYIISVRKRPWSEHWDGDRRGKEGDTVLAIDTAQLNEGSSHYYVVNFNSPVAQDIWDKVRTGIWRQMP